MLENEEIKMPLFLESVALSLREPMKDEMASFGDFR
jgi:hypothetical protein